MQRGARWGIDSKSILFLAIVLLEIEALELELLKTYWFRPEYVYISGSFVRNLRRRESTACQNEDRAGCFRTCTHILLGRGPSSGAGPDSCGSSRR